MELLFKHFLEQNITADYSTAGFDYTFDINGEKEQFLTEYKKFLGVYRHFFYNNNRFVTIINSREIRLQKPIIKQIFVLYMYADKSNFDNEKYILIDFLYTYFKTINTKEYKSYPSECEAAKNEFKMTLNEFELTNLFFVEFPNLLYDFYIQLLNYGISNEIYIDDEIINRIFNNLSDYQNYNNLIEIFIVSKNNLNHVIRFDRERNKHVDIYLEYIKSSLSNFYCYNDSKEMIFILDKSRCLDENKRKIIINKYIDLVNDLCHRLKDKKYSFIHGLSEIEALREELVCIIQKVETLQQLEKEKIRQCLKQILKLKRFIVSDENYVSSEMQKIEFEEKISTEEVEQYINSLLDNKFRIYYASKVDFINQIGAALEFYSQYPLQSTFTRYIINSDFQVYSMGKKNVNNKKDDNFKKYFDEKGKLYTKSKPKLLNKFSKNYYEEFLNYLSQTFYMQQSFILTILGQDNFRKIINQLKQSIGYDFDNDYAIVVSNILAIESCIVKIMEKANIKNISEGFDNINTLVEIYKEDGDKVNGFMYLNYTLYEKTGLNLRNNMMHGTLINSNLDVPLLVSFAGLVFVSVLINEK